LQDEIKLEKIVPIIKIHRVNQGQHFTLGQCSILDVDLHIRFSSVSLERGWQNNKKNISCVPIGFYRLEYEYSNKFKRNLWELKEVPGRSECKFHSANYWRQLNGCISLGTHFKDIDKDNYLDAVNSKRTMDIFHEVLKGYTEAILIITGEPNVK
jgi:hypothetical protein